MTPNPEHETFIHSYLTTALWSTLARVENCEYLDENSSIEDLAPETLKALRENCEKFLLENEARVNAEGKEFMPWGHYAQAGHDFWLTHNGHGAGFWDGDWPEYGELLTEKCEAYPEIDLYVGDDGKIYA